MDFSFSIDHAEFIANLSQWWDFINPLGISAGILNLVCGIAIYNVIRHLGDDDRDLVTQDQDLDIGSD